LLKRCIKADNEKGKTGIFWHHISNELNNKSVIKDKSNWLHFVSKYNYNKDSNGYK